MKGKNSNFMAFIFLKLENSSTIKVFLYVTVELLLMQSLLTEEQEDNRNPFLGFTFQSLLVKLFVH